MDGRRRQIQGASIHTQNESLRFLEKVQRNLNGTRSSARTTDGERSVTQGFSKPSGGIAMESFAQSVPAAPDPESRRQLRDRGAASQLESEWWQAGDRLQRG